MSNYFFFCRLYERLGEEDNAAAAYTKYCTDELRPVVGDQTELYHAYKTLAHYHSRKGQLEEANNYAYMCLEHLEVRNQVK